MKGRKNSHGGHGGAEGDNVGGRCHFKIVAGGPARFLGPVHTQAEIVEPVIGL